MPETIYLDMHRWRNVTLVVQFGAPQAQLGLIIPLGLTT